MRAKDEHERKRMEVVGGPKQKQMYHDTSGLGLEFQSEVHLGLHYDPHFGAQKLCQGPQARQNPKQKQMYHDTSDFGTGISVGGGKLTLRRESEFKMGEASQLGRCE